MRGEGRGLEGLPAQDYPATIPLQMFELTAASATWMFVMLIQVPGPLGGGQYSRVLQVSRPEIIQMVGRGSGGWDVSVETKGTPSPTKGAKSGL